MDMTLGNGTTRNVYNGFEHGATSILLSKEGDAEFRLQILELASLNDKTQRIERLAALEAGIGVDGTLSELPPEEVDPVIEQAVERVSRALAIALFRRRVGAVVPLVGSVIGGAVNVSFQGDVGEAARFAFQERRLRAGGN